LARLDRPVRDPWRHLGVEFAHPREIIEHDESLEGNPRGDDPLDEAEGHRLALVIALDHAANGEPRVVSGYGERRVEMVAADIVEIDIDAVGSGACKALEDWPRLVVDDLVGA